MDYMRLKAETGAFDRELHDGKLPLTTQSSPLAFDVANVVEYLGAIYVRGSNPKKSAASALWRSHSPGLTLMVLTRSADVLTRRSHNNE